MINKRNDLIEEMDNQIDSKKFYSFYLGVILYMIAIQYHTLYDINLAISFCCASYFFCWDTLCFSFCFLYSV